jgi:hypothetical protein
MRITTLFALLVVTLSAASGCKPDLIAGTQVEDSEENRKVLEFLTRYQAAMQSRKSDDVVQLCAADYFETNGNDKPDDDYNLDGLRERLNKHFEKTKELTLEVYVQKVERNDAGIVAVAYRYNTRALVAFPAGEKWVTATDVSRIVLRPVENDEAGFRIVSGL